MKQNINEAFSTEESKEIYDKFLSIVGTRRDNLVKRYGSGAEQVAYATAVNQVKKKAANKTEEPMEDTKLKEMVKAALSKPLDKTIDEVNEGMGNDAGDKVYFRNDLGKKYLPSQGYYGIIEDISPASNYNMMAIYQVVVYDKNDNEIRTIKTDWTNLISTSKPLDEKKKSFPDLTGDGKVTKADILKARGVELDEDIDLGHQDNEPHMIKAELAHIAKYAMELYKMVDQFEGPQEVDFPGWWQAKITTARNMISSAKHYLEFELDEPKIDAMVGITDKEYTMDEEMTPEKSQKIGMPFKDIAETVLAKLKNK
jgi:hypothetical protein